MKVLVTGANGFIAKNLISHLSIREEFEVLRFNSSDNLETLRTYISESDFIFHLAGVNRPKLDDDFNSGNKVLTEDLCRLAVELKNKSPIVYSSSTQAINNSLYGISKKNAEIALCKHREENKSPVYIYRLPNVYGKWARPNYNSVIATFCNNVANDLPIKVNDPSVELEVVYIDDLVEDFIKLLDSKPKQEVFLDVSTSYKVTVGELREHILKFKDSRQNLIVENVGSGFIRTLYSTYLSYIPVSSFHYSVPVYTDERGSFLEMLKTKDSGQISFFTAKPGVTRGGHYHHSKNEKFLVVKGSASFKFRHIETDEKFEICVSDERYEIVETIPGWAHDITNTSSEEMIVMLWANEIFDKEKPDTFAYKMI